MKSKELEDRENCSTGNIHDHCNEAIYLRDREGNVLDYNTSMLDLFGYNENEMDDMNIARLYKDMSDKRVFETEISKKGFLKDYSIIFKKKDGTELPCRTTTCSVKSDDGTLIGYQGTIRDVSQHDTSRNVNTSTSNTTEESIMRKSDLFASLCHEVKKPLKSIVSYSDQATNETVKEKRDHYLSIIRLNCELMLDLVDNVQEFSFIASYQTKIVKIKYSIKKLISDVATAFTLVLQQEKKNITLNTSISSTIEDTVIGDPDRLMQLLNNVLSSAVKFMIKGIVNIEVSRLSKDLLQCIIRYSEEETSAQFTEHNPVNFGLGMTINRRLINLMDGELIVYSQGPHDTNDGTVIHFILPYIVADDSVECGEGDNNIFKPVIEKKNAKILLVEDNIINQQLTRLILEKMGFIVTTSINGEDGFNKFVDSDDIDLIIMDIEMPVMDGMEALKKIRVYEREISKNSPITVIALTASALPEVKKKCINIGFNDFVTKPVSIDFLKSVIKKYFP